MKRVEIQRSALREAAAAYRWYAAHNEQAANRFLAELDRALDAVATVPQRYPTYLRGTRRYVFRKFPYSLVYRDLPDRVQVVAIAHGRREPGYWDK